MVNETLLIIFIALVAAAIVMQAAVLYGVYKAIEQIRLEIQGVRGDMKQRLDPLTQSLVELINDSRESVKVIAANAAEISRMVRDQTTRVNGLVGDVVERSRLQFTRVEQMANGIVERINNVTTVVEHTLLEPLKEVSAVMKGIRVGVEFLRGRRHPVGVADVRQDEEMFI